MARHSWNPFTAPPEQSSEPEPSPLEGGGYVIPLPDKPAGINFPYRGGEQHGISVDYSPDKPAEEWEGGFVGIREQEPTADPILVRVVEESAKELRNFRVAQHTLSPSPTLVLGRYAGRTRCTIRNTSPDKVAYVSSSSSVTIWTGYPIPPNSDLDLGADGEVWGISADATAITLATLIEYTVSV
jgi:hypothetical protein